MSAPGQSSTSNLAAANFDRARSAPIAAAERATGSNPTTGAIGSYEAAQAEQAPLRETTLAPLLAGPIGKLANKPEVSQAIAALFPRNPVPNSAGEVLDAVGRLSKKNPWAARQLVRAHVESVFNNATRNLQSGANQFGGASFRAQLVGEPQQAANLAAAIKALPHGDAILPGFDRMLEIMEATGQRQRVGSQTAFNAEMQQSLKTGGLLGEGTSLVAGAGVKLPGRIREAYERWSMGRNVDAIAKLLVNPDAVPAFIGLAKARPGSAGQIAVITRLAALAGVNSGNKSAEANRD